MWITRGRAGRRAFTSGLAAVAVLAIAGLAGSDEPTEAPILLYFADGSSVPLTAWSLSYEYEARPKDAAPSFGQSLRREARDLRSGKKILSVAGGVLEVQYREYEEARDVEGETRNVKVATATALVLTVDAKKNDLRLDPPDRDLLVAGQSEKGLQVRALGVDVRGTTLTGAKRTFCLASYVYDVQCHPEPPDRVVKIEFPRGGP